MKLDLNVRVKHQTLAHYSPGGVVKCAWCPVTDERVLQLDHVNGDGAEHRGRSGLPWGSRFYYWLRRNGWPNDPPLRVLCANCQVLHEWARRRGL
jgi:hypothetical protein